MGTPHGHHSHIQHIANLQGHATPLHASRTQLPLITATQCRGKLAPALLVVAYARLCFDHAETTETRCAAVLVHRTEGEGRVWVATFGKLLLEDGREFAERGIWPV